MTARRTALACTLAASALALGACGMMGMRGSSPMMADMMTVPLSAAQEVPPNSSPGTGTGRVQLDGTTLRWNITYSGTTGPVTAAHFHGPAPAGANAGVVLGFQPPVTSPINGSATVTPAQIADIKAGRWYINLHTAANPGGEIRGQVR